MSKVPHPESTTLWIVSVDAHARSYGVHRGPRTVRALTQALQAERRAGRTAHLELETSSCSPVQLSVAELAALGILDGDVTAEVRS